MSDLTSIQSRTKNIEVSPEVEPYTRVIIHVSDELEYTAGDSTGRTLEIDNPFGTQAMANKMAQSLRGFRFQPFSASEALLDPAAEIGDAVNARGVYGGIYKRKHDFRALMKTDISAPKEEELNNEAPYVSPIERKFQRQSAEVRASLILTNDRITSEVTRATEAEGQLSSQITQTASEISATVSGKVDATRNNSSFGWTLTNTAWTLKANNSTVFKVTKDGAEITGKVTAKSGKIGGFNIGSSAIYNGPDSMSSWTQGVYIGTNGISIVGAGGAGVASYFSANSSGTISAKNMTLSGTLKIGGKTITAEALQSGAASAYSNSSTWSGTSTSWANARAGKNAPYGPDWFSAYNLQAQSQLFIGNTAMELKTASVMSSTGGTMTIQYLGPVGG